MEFSEYLGVLGGIAALLGLQGFWINRSLGRVEAAVDRVDTALNDHKAESHSDMATLTSHIADLRERVAKIEG